jgi:galactose mutarotase-like enzyme
VAEWITIVSDHLTAAINPLGAELSSLQDADGRELMTDADPAFWGGRAPLLFPVVGQPSNDVIRVEGREYPMQKHGFARHLPFTLSDHAADNATFTLNDSAETRAQYPFAFRLDITFRADAATLHTDVTIHNPGDAPLPASFGFHPAFAWPLPYGQARENHRIVFASNEPDALKTIAADGTISPREMPSPLENRTLHLTNDLFAHDALVWDNIRSDRVTYGADTGPHLDIVFPDAPKLGIWTKPGAHFICIEPWHGIADPEGYTGEYRDKPGVFEVAPGAQKRIGMSVTLVAEP